MAFRFRFQRILDLKVKQEERQQERVARCLAQLNEAEERVRACVKAVSEARNELRRLQRQSPLPLGTIRDSQSLMRLLQFEWEQAVMERDAAAALMDEARKDLIAAVIERRQFEHLHERDAQEYEYLERRLEQGEMDEIGLLNHTHRLSEAPS